MFKASQPIKSAYKPIARLPNKASRLHLVIHYSAVTGCPSSCTASCLTADISTIFRITRVLSESSRDVVSQPNRTDPPPPRKPDLPEPDTAKPATATAKAKAKELYENIYTIPNALTVARMIACPFIGYYVVHAEFAKASALLFVAGVSDLVDGFLARRYGMGSVIGSVLDPAADKLLMTTMVVTLAIQGMMPIWLATLILGRDVALSISAFYFRYVSLPPPKTFKRFWDFSIPSAQAVPTQISKYNTFLQLVLVGAMTVAPLLDMSESPYLTYLQYIVAATTVASGASYLTKGGVKFVK